MFYNQDFEGVKGLMSLGTLCGCLTSIYVPPFFTFSWEKLEQIEGIGGFSWLHTGFGVLFLTLLFLVPALYEAARKCQKRIHAGLISRKQGLKSYMETILIYLVIGVVLSRLAPYVAAPILELRRTVVPYGP